MKKYSESGSRVSLIKVTATLSICCDHHQEW